MELIQQYNFNYYFLMINIVHYHLFTTKTKIEYIVLIYLRNSEFAMFINPSSNKPNSFDILIEENNFSKSILKCY